MKGVYDIQLFKGDVLTTACGHGNRQGTDIVKVKVAFTKSEKPAKLMVYCKTCEKTIFSPVKDIRCEKEVKNA